ncbi:UPF0481 protein isoform X4 [Gossypium australe]|uniref:UPF0481 protein isoform X4 n=1 Tax=Gossypium australe TaxID=47621 RepID=A0A5B6WZV3_9ROSI|nr:UPF0481 protein isoform X4 [Gossypium australe]
MGRSSLEMTLSYFDIEKGYVDFEYGLSCFQEKMISKNNDLATTATIRVQLSTVNPPSQEEPHLVRMEGFKKRQFENIIEKTYLGLHQFREAMKHLEGKTRKCYEQPLHPDLEISGDSGSADSGAEEMTEARRPSSRSLIYSAIELEDAGIHFFGVSIQNMQNQEKGKMNMFDMEFDNDTKELKIPTLNVDHSTERTFQNYMAYEQL